MDTVPARTNALAELDESPFTLIHLKSVAIAGAGFFGDAYDIFVIGIALPMIYRVYYPPEGKEHDQHAPSDFAKKHPGTDSVLKVLTNIGSMFGQLIFGYLGDSVGRKKIYGIEIILMLIATFGSALSSSTVRGISVLGMIGFWRFILGLGIGGDYPLSATITSEFAHSKCRGMMVAAVFAMQGLGIVAGGILSVLFLYSFSSYIKSDIFYLDYVWRLMLGFGVVPCVASIYYRLTMPESPRYKEFVKNKNAAKQNALSNPPPAKTVSSPDANLSIDRPNGDSIPSTSSIDSLVHIPPGEDSFPKTTIHTFKTYFSDRKNLAYLFATSYSWFALDIAWYGLTINTQLVLARLGFGESDTGSQYEAFWTRSVGNVIISILGTVPGYWVTVFTIDKIGRKKIQMGGFLVIALVLLILGAFWNFFSDSNNKIMFIAMFTIAQFFFNFGPNETTFIYPAELFPTVIRSRAHGISACSGKLGAVIGVYITATYFYDNSSFVLILLGLVMLSGALATIILPETMNMTLEETSGEFQGNRTPPRNKKKNNNNNTITNDAVASNL